MLCRLTGFFKGLGVKAVLDTNTGRDIALLEAAAEFLERYKAAHPGLKPDGETMICIMPHAGRRISQDIQEQRETSFVYRHLSMPLDASAGMSSNSKY